jgi:transcriptional regulator with XRE-family HTH domain
MSAKSPDPGDKHVGSRVRMRRRMLDISQSDLADALGMSFQQVQKYEKGTNRIGASRLQQIANLLHVPVDFFFEGLSAPSNTATRTAEAFSHTDLTELAASSEGRSLIKAYAKINSRTLKLAIVHLVEAIVGGDH